MAVFDFFEVDPRALFGIELGSSSVGSEIEITSDFYDGLGIGTATTDDASDDGFLEDFYPDVDASVTLSDGTVIANAPMELEATWTLEWTDAEGATQTVNLGLMQYQTSGADASNMIADGLLPPPGVTVTVTAFVNTPDTDAEGFAYGDIGIEIACFAHGTKLRTASGNVCVEDLKVGDMVMTRDHGPQPVRWIGSRTVAAAGTLAPVVIREGALGNTGELVVSPCHRMMLNDWRAEAMVGSQEVLVAARDLVGQNDGMAVREGGTVEYFHVMFDRHEIIFAEGAPSESFNPSEAADTLDARTRAELLAIFPELGAPDFKIENARATLRSSEAQLLRS